MDLRTEYEKLSQQMGSIMAQMTLAEHNGDWDTHEKLRKKLITLDNKATKIYRTLDDQLREKIRGNPWAR